MRTRLLIALTLAAAVAGCNPPQELGTNCFGLMAGGPCGFEALVAPSAIGDAS